MKKLVRVSLFIILFGMTMAVASMALYKLNISWLSPNFITPTYCVIIALLVSRIPGVHKFLNAE